MSKFHERVAALIHVQEIDDLESSNRTLGVGLNSSEKALSSANRRIVQLEQELSQAKSGLEFWKGKCQSTTSKNKTKRK